ncbi:hypothetical protein Tco_0939702 [Tanacetum coccineum]|uniref:Uncharacterized protein n=1 Tax=Tanacetum coccineum TaxID=301880 RepID=A0ABQ5DLC9_9ASTR
MAYTSNSSGSDTEVQSCSKNCVKTYEKLQKQFDEQRQTLSKANLEIVAYQLGLESVEAQLVVHQKNEVVYEEKIAVLEFEVKDKSNAITRLKNQLDETLREKDDLKAKLEQFETSSKNLTKLINSQISSKDKTGLGYGDQLNENDSSGSELFNSVFDSRSSDGDDNQTNDRFKKDNGYHAVPPPLTGSYMPPLTDLSFAGLDDSVYRPTAKRLVIVPSGVIIKDWVSDDDEDIFQSNDLQATNKPNFKKIEHMTGNKDFFTDYQDIDGGFFAFGGSARGGKFDGKAEEGFLSGYSVNSKAFRLPSSDEVYKNDTADDAAGETLVPKPASKNEQTLKNVLDKMIDQEKEAKEQSDAVRKEFEAQCNRHHLSGKSTRASSTNSFNTVSTPVNTAGGSRIFGDAGSSFVPLSKFTNLPHDPLMPDFGGYC